MEEKDSEISRPCEEFRIWFCGEVPSGSVAWYCIDVSETTESSTKKLNPFSVSNHFPSDYYALLEGCIYSLGGQGSDETLLNDVWILDIKSLDSFAARGEEKPQEWLLACGEAQMAAKPYGPDSVPYCKPQEPEKAWPFGKPRPLLARDPDEERLLAAQQEGLRLKAEQQERLNAEHQERLKETMRRRAWLEELMDLEQQEQQERLNAEQQERLYAEYQERLKEMKRLRAWQLELLHLKQQEQQERLNAEQPESLGELIRHLKESLEEELRQQERLNAEHQERLKEMLRRRVLLVELLHLKQQESLWELIRRLKESLEEELRQQENQERLKETMRCWRLLEELWHLEHQERLNAEQQESLGELIRRLEESLQKELPQQERPEETMHRRVLLEMLLHLEQQEQQERLNAEQQESLGEPIGRLKESLEEELRQQESQEMQRERVKGTMLHRALLEELLHLKQQEQQERLNAEQQESLGELIRHLKESLEEELRQQERLKQTMPPLAQQERLKQLRLLHRESEKGWPRKSFSKMPERRGWRSSIKPGVKVVKHFREHWEEEDWKPGCISPPTFTKEGKDWKPDSGSGETWKPNYVVPPWIRGPQMTFARCNPHTMVVDQKLYVLGGFEPNQSQAAGWIEVFDPVVGEWEVLPSPPDQIHSSVMISGLLKAKGEIIIAKQRRDRHPMLFYSYNILTRCWNTLVPHESNVIVHLPPNAGRAVTVGNTLYWISTEEHNHECIIRAYDLDRNMWFKDHLNTATIFGRRERFSSIYSSRPGFLHLRDQKFCLLLQSSITKDYPESSIKYLYCVTLDISPIYEHEDRGKFELTIVSFQKYSMDQYINFLDCMLGDRVSGVKSVDRRGQSTSTNISIQEMLERSK